MGWQEQDGTARDATGGKRIRPALCLFASSLFSTDPTLALPGAVAVELVHNFSLVHDEVQDRDAERHHRPTVWAIHGEGQAINAGDFLIARAINALVAAKGPEPRRMAALGILIEAMARMIAGQWSDIAFETRDDVSPVEYIEMIRGKTGALLGAPLAMGALLAGAPPEQATALQHWGETLGLAFQVRDDYLGIWGDPNLTGKSNVNDILRKKKTLPIVFGLSHESDSAILNAYQSNSIDADAVSRVVASLESLKAPEFVQSECERLVSVANEMLAGFELPDASRLALRQIGTYLIDRDR